MMSEDAYFNQEDIVKVDAAVIKELKIKAQISNSGRYRLCMHHSPQDSLHEMLIVRRRGDYGRPEKHMHTSESHVIVEGAMLIFIFDEEGNIQKAFELSEDGCRSYRMAPGIYHTSIPLTEQVVYYETKLGPFPNEGNLFAEWVPEAMALKQAAEYMKDLEQRYKNICEVSVK